MRLGFHATCRLFLFEFNQNCTVRAKVPTNQSHIPHTKMLLPPLRSPLVTWGQTERQLYGEGYRGRISKFYYKSLKGISN